MKKKLDNRIYARYGVSKFFVSMDMVWIVLAITVMIFIEIYWFIFPLVVVVYFMVTYNRVLFIDESKMKCITPLGFKEIYFNKVKGVKYLGFLGGPPGVLKIITNDDKSYRFESDYVTEMVVALNFLKTRIPFSSRVLRGFPVGIIDYKDGSFFKMNK